MREKNEEMREKNEEMREKNEELCLYSSFTTPFAQSSVHYDDL